MYRIDCIIKLYRVNIRTHTLRVSKRVNMKSVTDKQLI